MGGRSTQTKQSSTLFVTNLDPSVSLEQVAALFEHEPGFFAFRTVRRMCFVDFHSVSSANLAMRKRQNHSFDGAERKLLIDYDKDPTEKRDKQFAAQVGRELEGSDNAELIELVCSACGAFCIKLRIPPPRTFLTLPRRPIDSSVAVETGKYVVELQLAKGEERAIRRSAAGTARGALARADVRIDRERERKRCARSRSFCFALYVFVCLLHREGGVELQYRLVCKGCKIAVAYSSTPSDPSAAPIKHVFLMAGSLRGERKEIRAGKVVHTEKNMRMQPTPKIATAATDAASPSISAASSSSAAAAASASSTDASSVPATAASASSSSPAAAVTPSVAPAAAAAATVATSSSDAASADLPLDSPAAASSADSAASDTAPAPASEAATTAKGRAPAAASNEAATSAASTPVFPPLAADTPVAT